MPSEATSGVLAEVAKWRKEELGAVNQRYFYRHDEVGGLVEGETCFVVGRKGTGKTAIAEHIRGLKDSKTYVQKLTFRSFPFERLYENRDETYAPDSQYISLWKFVIYSAVCQMMARNPKIGGEVAADLKSAFEPDLERALSHEVRRLTDPSLELKIFNVGGGYAEKTHLVENRTVIADRARILETIIRRYIDSSTYYVLFDELDEDFNRPEDTEIDSRYVQLLAGLFKAVTDVRSAMEGLRVYPIVSLRDDIFALIQYSDRSKWEDDMVRLVWTRRKLQNLIAHRLSRASEAEDAKLDFESAWALAFAAEGIRHGRNKRRERSPFSHMERQTYMRPRDAIVYLRECARVACEGGQSRITPEVMQEADEAYSHQLLREMEDEIHTVLPEVRLVFERLRWLGKGMFRHDEFKEFYEENRKERGTTLPPFEPVRDILFDYSILGRRVNTRTLFNYQTLDGRLKPLGSGDTVAVHRGLHQSLQLFQ